MDKTDLIYTYEPLWGSWNIENLAGIGSTGNVYKLFRKEYNKKYESALKFILVPTYEQYKSAISYFNNRNINSINEYFEDIVQNILNEIELLYDLKEHGNIINYEDHLIKKIYNKNEWHILIRMEYATSLDKHILNNKLSEKDIANIGIDICSALNFCHNKNILHRDIKEANIFVSKNKIYKLGDFSISKVVSNMTMEHTKIGTFTYMAPEVFNNKAYTKRADLYSLGIVLYKLLNHCRMPFLPEYPKKILPHDIEKSNLQRLSGKEITKPSSSSDNFFKVLKKACTFDQDNRYQSAQDMKDDLVKIYKDCSDKALLLIKNEQEFKLDNTKTFVDLEKLNNTYTYNKLPIPENLSSDDADKQVLKKFSIPKFFKNINYKKLYNQIFKMAIIILPAILIIILIVIAKNHNKNKNIQMRNIQAKNIQALNTQAVNNKILTKNPDKNNISDNNCIVKTMSPDKYFNNKNDEVEHTPTITDNKFIETPFYESTSTPEQATETPEPTQITENTLNEPTTTSILTQPPSVTQDNN